MEVNNTWTVQPLPLGKKPISCKWLFKLKLNSDGSVAKHKARLVARGFTQQYGLDFQETFSPVAKITTLRVLLAVAASNRWHLAQLDVNNAFLNGTLAEEIYMQIPPGYSTSNTKTTTPLVCKLNRSIYGLKQASRSWFNKFSNTLISHGFTQSKYDYTLKGSKATFIAVLVYVDDIVLASPSSNMINGAKNMLQRQFKLKDLGDLKFFLGLELLKSREGIYLCQRHYTLAILEDCGMLACKPSAVPMEANLKLHTESGTKLLNPGIYRRLIRRLSYLTISRLDICYAVHKLSQFVSNPHSDHMNAVNVLLRYLKNTAGQGILFKANSDTRLHAYVDVDWGSCIDSRRSTTGFCIFLGNSLISWKAKRQKTVSRSSAEAEYRSLASVASELVWLKNLLTDFQVNTTHAAVYCDNKAAIHIAFNPTFHEKTKHLEIDLHFVREQVSRGMLKLFHVRKFHQLADVFTKALPRNVFLSILSKMGVDNIFLPS
uniref:Retrovirus-related Pol polyprotein from transposon TNT 1-94 n=1 Tax=Cajanus cajan TaxID=3821 RepID=A0A151S4N9_CAJCA|nr:Retrovirus-related Pol polyprotein from transposon TNT 1-94 [Cajanus cajan]